MTELLQDLKQEDDVEKLCKERSLNLSLLRPLFILSMRGYNNNEIAQKIGVHRVTIQRYTATLRKLKESEFQKLYIYILEGGVDHNEKRNKNE